MSSINARRAAADKLRAAFAPNWRLGLGSRSGDRGRLGILDWLAPLPETVVDRTTARGRRSAAQGVSNFLPAADLFRLDIDMIFVDTTTAYSEIDAADEAAEE
jgi:hypothetical protein